MLRAVVAAAFKIAYVCMPPPVYLFMRKRVFGYVGWRKLSPIIKNWRLCWMANTFKSAGRLIGKNYGLSLEFNREGLIEVSYCCGIRLLCFPSSLGAVSDTQRYFERFAGNTDFKPGDIVIDLGAHVGAVSVPLAFRGITVFAYEPNPDNFRVLELNKSLNGLANLHIFQLAVGKSTGTGTFEIGPTSTTGSMSTVDFFIKKRQAETVEVQTTTLGALFCDNLITQAKLLKVDCEGSEYDVLIAEDAKDLLRKCEFLILEAHPVASGHDKYQLYSYLMNLGFQIEVIDNPGNGCADFYCTNRALREQNETAP